MLENHMKTMKSKAHEALLRAVTLEESGLAGDSPAAAMARLLGVAQLEDGRWQLEVASDGLDLGQKIALEQVIKDHFAESFAGEEVPRLAVYFKRQHAAPAAAAAAKSGPVPLSEKKAPFGLVLNRRAIPRVREIIVVASGKGGVGKSTVSANLAVALAQKGQRVGLLDADIYGPSAPLMLGVRGPLDVNADNRLIPGEGHGVKVVSFGFLTDTRHPVIWRGPLVAKALRQLCYDVEWGDIDYLIVDLPPGTGDVQLALIESLPIHGALIVTTPQDVALLDAHKALSMFERLDVPIVGLVENMAHFSCPECGHEEPVFGHGGADRMAAERGLKVVARVPLALPVREGGDVGRPVALAPETALGKPFVTLAEKVLSPYS